MSRYRYRQSWRRAKPDDDEVLTVGEALYTIKARLRRLHSSGNHPVNVQLSERLEQLHRRQFDQVQASVELLRDLLDLAPAGHRRGEG